METTQTTKRFYKSRHDRVIDGICGGLAEYFEISPLMVRLVWILSIFFGGAGIAAYIAAMILVPINPHQSAPSALSPDEEAKLHQLRNRNHGLLAGIVLVIAGIIFLLDELNLFSFHWIWHNFPWKYLLPSVLIFSGIVLIINRTVIDEKFRKMGDFSGLHRKSSDKKLLGVCAGLGEKLNLDVSILRVLWVLFTLTAFPIAILAYVLLAVITPDENGRKIFDSTSAKKQS